jgi:protein CpxP
MLMKITFLSVLFSFFSLVLFAQQKPTMSSMTPEQKADEIVAKLKTDVGLTDEQIPKVKAISLDRVNKNTAAFKKIGPNDKARLLAANKSVLAEWETQLKAILTEDQYAKYLQTK